MRKEVAPAIADTESDEITDPIATLAGLKRKADVMVDMMSNNQVEEPAIGRTRWIVMAWFSGLVKDGGINGLDNLQRAVNQARIEKKRIIFTPAHLADADHLGLIYLLGKRRFPVFGSQRGLGIQDEMVFLGGAGNMKLRKSIRKFTRAAHIIYNITPRDATHLQDLQENAGKYEFDEEQKETLGYVESTFKQMRINSKDLVEETCVKQKKPVVAYIEGGRSYDGKLKPPLGFFATLIPRSDSAIIVPCRIYGTRELNPPGKDPNKILRRELWQPSCRHRISMIVGEPYSSSEVWEVWRTRRRGAKKSDSGTETSAINPMDWPMANIANLDSEYVRPEDLRHYAALMEIFAPERNRIPEDLGKVA